MARPGAGATAEADPSETSTGQGRRGQDGESSRGGFNTNGQLTRFPYRGHRADHGDDMESRATSGWAQADRDAERVNGGLSVSVNPGSYTEATMDAATVRFNAVTIESPARSPRSPSASPRRRRHADRERVLGEVIQRD